MSDNRSNRGVQDQSEVATDKASEVRYLMDKHGIKRDEVLRLIDKHGGDRRLIEQDLGDGDVVPLSRGFC